MHNKKILAKGLIFATALSGVPIDSLANSLQEYKTTIDNRELVSSNKEKSKRIFSRKVKDVNLVKVNKNIVKNSILEITVAYGDYVPDLSGNPGGYETIKVTTEGDKKLVKQDYDNLRLSGIPKIDLSDAKSDSIPSGAFTSAVHLTEFKFPQGVDSIGGTSSNNGAFSGCSGLAGNLVIPDTVTTIGKYAFNGCSGFTGSLVIPNGVTTIGERAFYNCSGFTGNLTIPNSVTSINDYAFYGCKGFTGDLIIPNGITSIRDSTFRNCSGFNGSLTIPDSIKTIAQYAFLDCTKLTGSLIIPDSVTSIGRSAFSGCKGFTGSLTIGNSVRSIGISAFQWCKFTGNLTIPNSVTSIGDNAFDRCSGFTGDLVIPDSVTSLGSSAFMGCTGFTGILTISNNIISIGNSTFSGCSGLTGNLTISNKVTSIGNSAFSGCDNIEKIIVGVNKSDEDLNYREDVIKNLPASKTHIEISYNLDISNTWLNSSTYIKVQPTISTYAGTFENNEGIGITLEIIEASPIKTMTILKDGENYNLEKSEGSNYIFNENGNYQVYLETEIGTISNIEFKNISPINAPSINIIDNNLNIVNNGILSSYIENFDNINNLKFNFSNSNWTIEDGILKSETVGHSNNTENEFIVNAKAGEKVQIRVKTSSENNYDWGYIYLNGVEAYKKSGTATVFEIIELDLQEGENIIKFKYSKDSSGSGGDDAMFIDYIKLLKKEVTTIDCDTLEYRINSGDWQIYTNSFGLNYPVGTKVLVEVRASHDGYVSEIFSQEVTVEFSTRVIEEAIEKAEQSKDGVDISDARDLVNQMPECSKKDLFQDRLNAIFPNIDLEKQHVTASSDIYIKFKSTLSLALDTNVVTFEDYSGLSDLEMLGAVNLTVSSSLPYQLNAYMPTEITNADGSKKIPFDILNIKEGSEADYQTFRNITDKVVLKDGCVEGGNNVHSIDLKLASNQIHKADVYKTVIKFEAEQK